MPGSAWNSRRRWISFEFHSVWTLAPGVSLVPNPPGPDSHAESSKSGLAHSEPTGLVVYFQVCGVVSEVVYLGTSTNYIVSTSLGADIVVFDQNASSADDIAKRGDNVYLSWNPQHSYAIGDR